MCFNTIQHSLFFPNNNCHLYFSSSIQFERAPQRRRFFSDFGLPTANGWHTNSQKNFQQNRRRTMTASSPSSGDHRSNSLDANNKETVYTVNVSSGYNNDAFNADGDDPIAKEKKQHHPKEISDEEAIATGKVKLSRNEKWRILKNVSAVSCAFMVQFTAFQGTANLQSSINAKDGLGTVSLSAIYAALVLSCMFLPTLIIKRLTVKWTLCLSMLCYAPYIASQFYPR